MEFEQLTTLKKVDDSRDTSVQVNVHLDLRINIAGMLNKKIMERKMEKTYNKIPI